MKKLDNFTELRKHNWHRLYNGLKAFSDYFILPQPTFGSNPSWFGFILTVKNEAGFKRQDVVQYLEKHNIQTRMLFAGNIIRHPCFNNMRKNKQGYRAVGDLENTDTIMNQTFWLGVYPGMTCEMLDFMIATIQEFIENHQLR